MYIHTDYSVLQGHSDGFRTQSYYFKSQNQVVDYFHLVCVSVTSQYSINSFCVNPVITGYFTPLQWGRELDPPISHLRAPWPFIVQCPLSS